MNYFKVIVITAPGLECYWNTAGAIAHMLLLCNGGKKRLCWIALRIYRCCVFLSLLSLDKPHSDQAYIRPANAPGAHQIDFSNKGTVYS